MVVVVVRTVTVVAVMMVTGVIVLLMVVIFIVHSNDSIDIDCEIAVAMYWLFLVESTNSYI